MGGGEDPALHDRPIRLALDSRYRAHGGRAIFTLVRQRSGSIDMDKQRRGETFDLAFATYADRFAESCTGKGWRRLVDRSLRLQLTPVRGSKPLPQMSGTTS